MHRFGHWSVVAACLLGACARSPRPLALRPVTPAVVVGDTALVQVLSAPRPGRWDDDLTVRSAGAAHMAIFEFSDGKARLRTLTGGEAHAVSSIHWWKQGRASREKVPTYHGGAAGETVCRSGVVVRTGPGEQGYVAPMACTEYLKRPAYTPTYAQTRYPVPLAALVVVADSAFTITDAGEAVRRFVEARANPVKLEMLASSIAPAGRWAAVVHAPSLAH